MKKIKVFGCAGTGKTTFIITQIEALIKDGWNIDDIIYCTFTKAGAREGAERMVKKFSLSSKPRFFSTIHSICYQLLGLHKQNVVTEYDRQTFANEIGEEYKILSKVDETDEPTTFFSSPDDEWKKLNIIMHFDERVRNAHQKRITEIDEAFADRLLIDTWGYYSHTKYKPKDFTIKGLQNTLALWEKWKEAHNKLDFTDMLLLTLREQLIPQGKGMFIDECQDLTPLQHSITLMWERGKKLVLKCGDDDQTIYDWAGASPRFLIEERADETIVLPISYRVPSIIRKFTEDFIAQNIVRQNKKWTSAKEGGFVGFTNRPLEQLRMNKKTLMLFRTNYLAIQFRDKLIEKGIPFKMTRGGQVWTDRLVNILNILCKKLEPSMTLNDEALRKFLLEIPAVYLARGVKTKLKTANEDDMPKTFADATYGASKDLWVLVEDPQALITLLCCRIKSKVQQKALRMRLPIGKIDGFGLDIGTIHSRKGSEAEDVFVFTELSKRILQHLHQGKSSEIESERRVFYVGMSRPKERLWIVPAMYSARFLFPTSLWGRNFGQP